MTYEIILEQSGMPEPTVTVIATTRRYNGAVNEVKRYGDDAAENMALHTDFYDGEDMTEHKVEVDGKVEEVSYVQLDKDGKPMRYRRVYLRKKVQPTR